MFSLISICGRSLLILKLLVGDKLLVTAVVDGLKKLLDKTGLDLVKLGLDKTGVDLVKLVFNLKGISRIADSCEYSLRAGGKDSFLFLTLLNEFKSSREPLPIFVHYYLLQKNLFLLN